MNVHQILASAGPHDAVTNQALAYRRCFTDWGWGGADYATYLVPGMGRTILQRSSLRPGPHDVLLIHHSAISPRAGELVAGPQPKLLVYHNITPAAWLWQVSPVLAVHCAVGRLQLPELIARVDVPAAVSAFNAEELRQAGAQAPLVVPPLLDAVTSLKPAAGSPVASNGAQRSPSILFVGRLSPHKRQDDVIRAFALYRRRHAPSAQLTLVGGPVTRAYGDRLRDLADSVAPGSVRFETGLSDQDLLQRYRSADAFLCLSEHEGFCLPLVEALGAGLPVVARRAGAVPETLQDAGLLLEAGDDLGVVAEAVHQAVSDSSLRRELRDRGERRLAAYSPEVARERLRQAVEIAVTTASER